MEINDQLFFRFSKEASLQVGAEIVGPTEPATLATAAKPSELRDSSPATLAIRENEVDELLILLGCPWPFLNAKFVTARLPSHSNTSLLVQIKHHQINELCSRSASGSPTLLVLKTQKLHTHLYIKSSITFPSFIYVMSKSIII